MYNTCITCVEMHVQYKYIPYICIIYFLFDYIYILFVTQGPSSVMSTDLREGLAYMSRTCVLHLFEDRDMAQLVLSCVLVDGSRQVVSSSPGEVI